MSAIRSFGFITEKQLNKFCELAANDQAIEDEYFERSTGWTSEAEFKRVSKKLAFYILRILDENKHL